MTSWFPKEERAKVYALYFLGNPLASIIAAPISGLILDHMAGFGGLKGWQWLFVLEGLPAVVLAFVVWRYLTNGPEEAESLTANERASYVDLMRKDRKLVEESQGGHFTLKQALTSGRVWILSLSYLCSLVGLYALSFWMLQTVKEFIPSNTNVGFAVSILYAIGAVWMYFWSAHSDATQERRWHFVITTAFLSGGFVITALSRSLLLSMIG